MDRALSRRYLKAMGVVTWRHRDSFDEEPAAEPEPMMTTSTAEPPPRPVASQAAPPTSLGPTGGRGGMAAVRAALGGAEAKTRAPRSPTTPLRDQLPPAAPVASAAPPTSAASAAPAQAEIPALSSNPAAMAEPESPIATMDWQALTAEVSTCRRCGLCEQRRSTVFGTGNRRATLMLVGEPPGQDEDMQGEPFVGRAGQLLTRMLTAIDLPREQVYIGNIIKCRPPGNRDPEPDEIAACRAFIERQIALVEPRLLLCLGRVSAQALLQTTEAVGLLRGRWHSFGPTEIPLLATYHPSYYLRVPAEKSRGWDDLQRVAQRLKSL